MVRKTVRHKTGRKPSKRLRDILERTDADGDDNAARARRLAVVEVQCKLPVAAYDRNDLDLFQTRDKPLLKSETIVRECVQPNRPGFVVTDRPFHRVLREGVEVLRVGEVRSER